jgi:hypothetical protein
LYTIEKSTTLETRVRIAEILWSLTLPSFYGGNFTCKTMKYLQLLGPYLRDGSTNNTVAELSVNVRF